MPKLDLSELHALHAAAITAGLDRDDLMSGVDKRFVASIHRSSSRSAQLLNDLHEMQAVERLSDGTVPLRTWLLNAVRLADMREEEATFEAALRRVDPLARVEVAATRPPALAQGNAGEARLCLYISASMTEKAFVERLRKHLSPFARSTGIEVWDRGQIAAGGKLAVAAQKLDTADIVILLVSVDFLAGHETMEECERALARRAHGARVIPVLTRPSAWTSSPLRGLTVLPRSGKAISSHGDIDAAFVNVVEEVRAVANDLLQRRAERHPVSMPPIASLESTSRDASTPRRAPPMPLDPGEPLTTLFERNGAPRRLYVEPAQARRIRASLSVKGRGLVIEGPSKIGKTTALLREMERVDATYRWLDASLEAEEIRAAIEARALEGHLIIDNAHALAPDLLARLARWLRAEADNRAPRGKLTILGIPGTTRRLSATQRDLLGRFDEVRMARQPEEKIRELVDTAERVGRLRFLHKSEIVKASHGSFQLAQMLCYECAFAGRVEVVGDACVDVAATVGDVRSEVQETLGLQFDDRVLSFVNADEATGTHGAGLAMLWEISQSGDERVALSELRNKYTALGPAWDMWERGGHERVTGEEGAANRFDPRELVQLSSGSVEAEDPLFRFYLQGVDWDDLARRADLPISWHDTTGALIVAVRGKEDDSKKSPTEAAKVRLYEETVYPYWHPDAITVRDLLVGAYDSIESLRMVAKVSGISLSRFEPANGAIEPAWNSLLDIATRQAKLEALMSKVLSDPHAKQYHKGIREALGNLGVEGVPELENQDRAMRRGGEPAPAKRA